MTNSRPRIYKSLYQLSTFALTFSFLCTSVYVQPAQAGERVMSFMPAPGVMVNLSPGYIPAHLMGMTIHPDNALKFDFLIHQGDGHLSQEQKRQEYTKLIKYFLASLTIPDKDQWVNLSPYEHNRIIADNFGKTEMGRDLLGQDYLLKQITSSLIYPEKGLGKKFWDKVYERAWKEYGSTNIPVNTFNKVWIIPDQAAVYESGNTVYVLSNHLKVMLEEDYFATRKNGSQASSVSRSIIRQIILPALEKEINEGKNFAQLRQIYSGMILATWYKHALKESLLGKVYANHSKVKGVDQDPENNERIYQEYLRAFKKGVFNFIKEDADKYTKEIIPRKYFSGGAVDFSKVTSDVTSGFQDAAVLVLNNKVDMGQMANSMRETISGDLAAIASDSIDRASTVLDSPGSLPGEDARPGDDLDFKPEEIKEMLVTATSVLEKQFKGLGYTEIGVDTSRIDVDTRDLPYPHGVNVALFVNSAGLELATYWAAHQKTNGTNFLLVLPFQSLGFGKRNPHMLYAKSAVYVNKHGNLAVGIFNEPVRIDAVAHFGFETDGQLRLLYDRKIPLLSTPDAIKWSTLKDQTNRFFASKGISVPREMSITEDEPEGLVRSEVINFINTLDSEADIVVKPSNAQRGEGVKMFPRGQVDSIIAHALLLKEKSPVLVQERIGTDLIDASFRVLSTWDGNQVYTNPKMVLVRYKERGYGPVNIARGAKAATLEQFFRVRKIPVDQQQAFIKQLHDFIVHATEETENRFPKGEFKATGFLGWDVMVGQDGTLHILELNIGPIAGITYLEGHMPEENKGEAVLPVVHYLESIARVHHALAAEPSDEIGEYLETPVDHVLLISAAEIFANKLPLIAERILHFGISHGQLYETVLQNLYLVLFNSHRFAEAEMLVRQEIQEYGYASGENFFDLGQALQYQRKYAEAEKAYREAIRIPQHYLESSYQGLSEVLIIEGKPAEAEGVMKEGIERHHFIGAGSFLLLAVSLNLQGKNRDVLGVLQSASKQYKAVNKTFSYAKFIVNFWKTLRNIKKEAGRFKSDEVMPSFGGYINVTQPVISHENISPQVQEYWDEVKANMDVVPGLGFALGARAPLNRILDELEAQGRIGRFILDIGSARNPVSMRLVEHNPGKVVIGVDLTNPFQPALLPAASPFLLVRGNVENLDEVMFRPEITSFLGKEFGPQPIAVDTIIISDVLNYVDYKKVITASLKYLRPGGKLIILNMAGMGGKITFSEKGVKGNSQLTSFAREQGLHIEAQSVLNVEERYRSDMNQRQIIVATKNVEPDAAMLGEINLQGAASVFNNAPNLMSDPKFQEAVDALDAPENWAKLGFNQEQVQGYTHLLERWGSQAHMFGPIVYAPFGGMDAYTPSSVVSGSTDIVAFGEEGFGSAENLLTALQRDDFVGMKFRGFDSQDDLEKKIAPGVIALAQIKFLIKGDIRRISFFDLNENGDIHPSASGGDVMVEFEVGDPKTGQRITKRFWYIQHNTDVRNVTTVFQSFIDRLTFQTMFVKGAFDMWGGSNMYNDYVKRITLTPSIRNKANVITDKRLRKSVLQGQDVIFNEPHPIWSHEPLKIALNEGERFGYSQAMDDIFYGPSSWLIGSTGSNNAKLVNNSETPGGIDLNSANLAMTIKRDGKGVPLPLMQQDMAQLGHIEGFEPEILEIKPAVDLPILNELRQKFQ